MSPSGRTSGSRPSSARPVGDRATAGAPDRRPPGQAGRAPASGPRGGASREELEQRAYDPRREERRKATRIPLPDDVEPQMLDPEARKELRTLSRETSDLVARHLVVTGQLLDEDPERALAHARAARALAGRVGVVREAAGLAAYAAAEWAEALSDLRAARRITGEPSHLAVVADCERALGRPERALAYADDPDVPGLPQDQRVELIIVLAGARRDLGQLDAAVLVLQEPARRTTDKRPWAARLWYAYADALLAAGRGSDAEEWFARAATVDVDGATDAGDRLLELQGVVLDDPEELDEGERDDLPSAEDLAELVRSLPGGAPSAEEDRGTAEGSTPDAGRTAPKAAAAGQDGSAGVVPAVAEQVVSSVEPPTDDVSPDPAPAGSDRGEVPVGEVTTEVTGEVTTERVEEPAPVVPTRGRVAPPTFVAPPSSDDDQDLRLFE